jgi:hypothetical protein
VVVVDNNGASISISSVLPNPFNDKLSVNVFVSKTQMLQIELIDETGRIIRKQQAQAVAGSTTFSLAGLASTSAGLYVVRVTTENAVLQQKVVRTKN